MPTHEILRKKEGSAFYYGLLSSRTSEFLKEYMENKHVSEDSKEVLSRADELIQDILLAEKITIPGKESVAPSKKAFEVSSCAFDLVLDHNDEFEVRNTADLITLFETLVETLQSLKSHIDTPGGKEIKQEDLARTRMFFQHLAKFMLTKLTAPRDYKLPNIKI